MLVRAIAYAVRHCEFEEGAARLVALERALLERRQHGVDAVACNGLEEGLAGGRREQVVLFF